MFLSKNHFQDDKVKISTSKSASKFENAPILSTHHKFVQALILTKIWDFSHFLRAKTKGIPPIFSFDATSTLEYRINIPSGINVPPSPFLKIDKHTPGNSNLNVTN